MTAVGITCLVKPEPFSGTNDGFMDLNHLMIWTVAAGCGMTLLQLLGQKNALRLSVLPVLILATLGVCTWWSPGWAGIVSGTLFVLLMLLPAWGQMWLNSLLMQKRYWLARPLALLLLVVRPDRELRGFSRLIHVMQLTRNGQSEQALALLHTFSSANSPLGRMALTLQTRLEGSWQEFLDCVDAQLERKTVFADPNLLDTYLQSLGETGQRGELFRQYEQWQSASPRSSSGLLNFVRAKLAAFSGDDFIVAQLFSGPLRDLPVELKRFWMATALQVSGQSEIAERDFRGLTNMRDAGIARAAQRRLTSPLPTLADIPLELWQAESLQRMSRLAEQDIQQGEIQFSRNRASWATWSIALVLVLVFLCEIPGGSENFENLERMGAMLIPPLAESGEGWRIVAAAFLHFGPLHLLMNLLGLIVLGRRVESAWGSWLTLITYLAAAIGSIGLAPCFIDQTDLLERTVLVGASGGVMGLLGALLVQSLFELLRSRNRPDRMQRGLRQASIENRTPRMSRTNHSSREFISLLLVVLLQMAFDANTPNVSSEAHLLGMTIGIVCGAIWNLIWLVRRHRLSSIRG